MVDLRRYTLYWDRLDFPDNNVINFVESGNNLLEHDEIITLSVSPNTATAIDYLKEADILQRTRVVIERPREFGAHAAFLHAQFEVFRQLEANEPGLWAIGQSAVDFLPPPDTTLPNRTVEIELVKALPTPPDDVSLSDVLEFKNRRGSELLALRVTLDELCRQIEDSGDIPRAKVAAVDRLALSLSDLHSAASESWPARIRSSLKIELNLPEIAAKAAIGLAMAVGLGVPGVIGAAAGAVAAASLKINVRELFAPSLPPHLRDFAYVYHHVNELR